MKWYNFRYALSSVFYWIYEYHWINILIERNSIKYYCQFLWFLNKFWLDVHSYSLPCLFLSPHSDCTDLLRVVAFVYALGASAREKSCRPYIWHDFFQKIATMMHGTCEFSFTNLFFRLLQGGKLTLNLFVCSFVFFHEFCKHFHGFTDALPCGGTRLL